MKVESTVTDTDVQLRLVPEGPIDAALLEEFSKVDASVEVVRNEVSVVLRKERGNGHFKPTVRRSGGEPCPR